MITIYDGIFGNLQDGNHHVVVRQPSRLNSDTIKSYSLDINLINLISSSLFHGLEKARCDVGYSNIG